jgi:hypothetical protein
MELALFGISALMSLVSSSTAAMLYVQPWLRTVAADRALATLVVPHTFLRFIGLSFLVPGVVSAALPAAFSKPAAYGDFIAGGLAIVAVMGLAKHTFWALAAVWVFNIWGAADLLFALYQGLHVQIDPGMLGAAFFIPTAIVPPLLVTHALIFGVLTRAR